MFWEGWGDSTVVNGCNKCESYDPVNGYHVYGGEDSTGTYDTYYPMGSLIVRPGCKMYLFRVRKIASIMIDQKQQGNKQKQ